jgi:hypothetical protein
MTRTEEMNGAATGTRSMGYRVGWWILVVLTGGSLVNHLLGPLSGFAEGNDELFVFLTLAALNVYTLAVLFTSYRRGERWAWWVTWAMIAVYAMTPLYASEAGRYYQGAAVVMAVAQLLTWSGFRQQKPIGTKD